MTDFKREFVFNSNSGGNPISFHIFSQKIEWLKWLKLEYCEFEVW